MHHYPLVKDLRALLGGENVISAPSELAVYECDAFTLKRNPPEAVVFPRSAEQVAAVVKIANRHGVPIVPRGAGTGLAGGCLPLGRSLVLMLTRINRVLEVSLRNRLAVVEAGVSNMQLSKALEGTGLFFAPVPSSQGASTIGGNVATNAGGPHWLKYGAAVNHVLGVEAVLADGSIIQLGPADDPASLDLVGLLVGSEGTLGIVTKVWLRLTPLPKDYRAIQAIFDSVDEAANAVTKIIAGGIIPSALELIDQNMSALMEDAFALDFPSDAGMMLMMEINGPTTVLDRQQQQIIALCKKNKAKKILQVPPAEHDELPWKRHRSVIGAIGRLSPDYFIQDVVVSRTQLPSMLGKIIEIGRKHQVRILSVAHLGDGSVLAMVLFDRRQQASVDRALAAGRQLLAECIALGGSVSAEHGIGVQKIDSMSQQFQPADLEAMRQVRYAFDPHDQFNPGKLLPAETAKDVENCRVSKER